MLGYTEEELRDKAIRAIEWNLEYTSKLEGPVVGYAVEYGCAVTRGHASMASMLGLISIGEEGAYVEKINALRKEKLDSLKPTK